MKIFFAFVVGLTFGIGLIIAGMANPAKVLAFLDLAGAWDPSLALVMVGAIVTSAVGYLIARKRQRAILGDVIEIPASRTLDRPLVIGSALFGIGWGIAGICPGPGSCYWGWARPRVRRSRRRCCLGWGCLRQCRHIIGKGPSGSAFAAPQALQDADKTSRPAALGSLRPRGEFARC